jgi:glycerol-3-phosphate dehydrogenase (NAD(P)+)
MKGQNGKVCVLGGGKMGTAIACLVAEHGIDVSVWVKRRKLRDEIEKGRMNTDYYPGRILPERLHARTGIRSCIEGAKMIILAVPSRSIRTVAREASQYTGRETPVFMVAKGVEFPPLRWMSEVIQNEMPGRPVAVISGPNFASELIDHRPSAMVIASESSSARELGRACLSSENLRIWETDDVKGVEICGCMKGLMAMVIGLGDAYGLGDNARGELIVQAIQETRILCHRMGANPETVLGPAGVGDMITTSFSLRSRSRTMGQMLGLGLAPKMAYRVASEGITAEGVKSVAAMQHLTSRFHLKAPLVDFAFDVLCSGRGLREAFPRLWARLQAQSG